MKRIFQLGLCSVFLLASCEKEDKTTVDASSANINAEVSASVLTLDKTKAGDDALTVSWNKTVVNVATPVRYNVSFSYNNTTQTTDLTSTTSQTLTVASLNTLCMKMGVPADVATDIQVVANVVLGNNKIVASSAPKKLTVTRYNQDFYLVGGATYVGWTANKAQKLYQLENGFHYAIYTYFKKDEPFRFLGQQDWNPVNYSVNESGIRDNYKYFKKYTNKFLQKDGDENIKFLGDTGVYKLVIDITDQSLSVEKITTAYDSPNLYLVGNITNPSWNENSALAMTRVEEGVFEITTVLKADAEFKFIGQRAWSPLQWGNFGEKAGDTGYLAPEKNSNIKFAGDGTSQYKITVNLKAGTYTIVKQ